MTLLNSFYKTLTEILDHQAPLIKITKKERTLYLKSWIYMLDLELDGCLKEI